MEATLVNGHVNFFVSNKDSKVKEILLNELLPLIANLSNKNNEYVLFVGAGVSKDASVKSGWEILIETLKPLYIEENKKTELTENYSKEIENWYLNHKEYKKLGYSQILEILYEGEIERREYLKKYFENTKPGEAHQQLAKLVINNLVKIIFTTNFDDLIEKALDEYGINYDVIFSDDILKSSKSWDKVHTCRIYKLHGDYKIGKVRNTIAELEKLEKLIAEDFQYIIDRHGLIILGYAGRDKGVMEHLIKRKPYHYPIYWQYVKLPPKNDEFKLFHKFIDIYKNKYKREIHLIQNNSASSFLSDISNGIENLERILIVSKSEKRDFRNYIINQDLKKIRALSIDLFNEFSDLYNEFKNKEDLNTSYLNRFEVYEEFIKKINFIYEYFDELLSFNLLDEAIFFLQRLLNSVISLNWVHANDFLKNGTPYHIMMNCGALLLKQGFVNEIELFYKLKIKYYSNQYMDFVPKISKAHSEDWKFIGIEKFKTVYLLPRYSINCEHLRSNVITYEEFNIFDAYITMDLMLRNLKFDWICGSSMYYENFVDAYYKYFDSKITSEEISVKFFKELNEKYNSYNDVNRAEGIMRVINILKQKFSISE